jgi:hypothetical protein
MNILQVIDRELRMELRMLPKEIKENVTIQNIINTLSDASTKSKSPSTVTEIPIAGPLTSAISGFL